MPRRFSRRSLLGTAIGLTTPAFGQAARASTATPRMPVIYLSHGSPRLATDPVRGPAMRAWGERLPQPRAILVMTPHYAARHIDLGRTGTGFAMYNLPRRLKRELPQDLEYATPPSLELAARVEAALRGYPVARGLRRGFDHTTWIPLSHLYPAASLPVLEISYPYLSDVELFGLGKRLAPLRDEGVLFLASGGMTHNLASIDFDAPPAPPPAWSSEFDAWAEQSVRAGEIDALLDWRHKAPAAELAHPDDGAHYRVLVVAAGIALGGAQKSLAATCPITGFEGTLSIRCVEFA